jgi:D-alanyl-D-alanine carboxypeptidase/D-alanyl-D-alanine-endopeptidase (penicillin-binding protein 4)
VNRADDRRSARAARADRARRLVVVALAGAAIAAIILGFRTSDAPASGPAGPTLGTPLWSVRRLPQPVIDGAGDQHLQTALAARAAPSQVCATVQDDTTGSRPASIGPTDALVPASTMKLLTATAAVATLGADFHFTTDAIAPGPVRDGSIARLYLVGGGDPLLATPERIALDQRDPDYAGLPTTPLADLADRIVGAGVRSIPGGVLGVDDRYDRTRYLAAWPAADRTEIGPMGALTVNDGRAGAAGTGANVADPAANAATELTRLLASRGVTVGAAGRADRAPDDATRIASLDSPPLSGVVEQFLSASDNLSAELVTRELGFRAGAGTTERGIRAIRDELTRLGIDLEGAEFIDGSGLSHSDRLRCPTLLSVLDVARQPRLAAVHDGLAIAGRRGTLATRLRGTSLEDNLRAKTGTLTGVSGLAGSVRSDRPMTFSLLLNGSFGQTEGYARREALAAEIGAYPEVTDPTTLVPEPFAPIPARACRGAEGPC